MTKRTAATNGNGKHDDDDERSALRDMIAERCVIGAAAVNDAAMDDAAFILKPQDFSRESHQIIWRTMLEMRDSGTPVDGVTLADKLSERGLLSQCGGPAGLLKCMESVPHAWNVREYARIVRKCSGKRASLSVCEDGIGRSHDPSTDPQEDLGALSDRIHELMERNHHGGNVSIGDLLLDVVGGNSRQLQTPIKTHFTSCDAIHGGVVPGHSIILGARPSVGKTAFMGTMARRMAEDGIGVGIYSLEMTQLEIAERLVASASGLTVNAMRTPNMLPNVAKDEILLQASILSKLPIWIDDRTYPINQLVTAVRLAVRRQKIGVVFIDYLQLIRAGRFFSVREQEVSHVSAAIKRLAKDVNVPIITACQLNRAVESRATRRPQLSDLRESGSIENDADQVWFLWRPNKDAAPDNEGNRLPDNFGEFIVAKHRSGELGSISLEWNGPLMRYSDMPSVGVW